MQKRFLDYTGWSRRAPVTLYEAVRAAFCNSRTRRRVSVRTSFAISCARSLDIPAAVKRAVLALTLKDTFLLSRTLHRPRHRRCRSTRERNASRSHRRDTGRLSRCLIIDNHGPDNQPVGFGGGDTARCATRQILPTPLINTRWTPVTGSDDDATVAR